MNRTDLEGRLQDYLDGRLSASDRAEFEAALAKEADLVEQVEFHLAVRGALRDAEIEPPAGIAARARARFEERRGGGARIARLLSWEAVGAIAAVAILAFVFLPFPWRDGDESGAPSSLPRLETPSEDETRNVIPSLGDSARRQDAPSGRPAAVPIAPPIAVPAPPSRPAPAIAEAEEKTSFDDSLAKREAPSPLSDAEATRGSSVERRERAAGVEALSAPAGAMQAESVGVGGYESRARELPIGALASEFVLVIRPGRENALSGIGDESVARAVSLLAPRAPSEAVALVGPRGRPFTCERYDVSLGPGELRLRLARPDPGRVAAEGGCAFVVPGTDLPLSVEEPPDGEK